MQHIDSLSAVMRTIPVDKLGNSVDGSEVNSLLAKLPLTTLSKPQEEAIARVRGMLAAEGGSLGPVLTTMLTSMLDFVVNGGAEGSTAAGDDVKSGAAP